MTGDARLLAVLAKFWTPGRVKTRLAAAIGDQAAAELHRQFVAVTLSRTASVGDGRWLAVTPPDAVPQFQRLAETGSGGWTVVSQYEGHLGERMKRLIESALCAGYERVVLIGADSPDLPDDRIEEAFDRLAEFPVVVGPSVDGGYYLIGASQNVPPIFDDIPWSTAAVAGLTVRRLREAGIGFSLLEPWRDVDDQADLLALRERLSQPAAELDSSLLELRRTIESWAGPAAVSVRGGS